MKILIAALTIVAMALVAVALACQYVEEPYRYYETYTRELHEGLWVPDIFPRDIKQIHEQHDIDTNQVWLRFTLGDQKIDLSQFNTIERDMTKVRKPFLAEW